MRLAGPVVCWICFLVSCIGCDGATTLPPAKRSVQTSSAAGPEEFVVNLRGIKGPKSIICKGRPCLRKCCAGGNVAIMKNITLNSGICENKKKLKLKLSLPEVMIYNEDLTPTNKTVKDNFQYIKGYNVIRDGFLHATNFYLTGDGALLTETPHVFDRWRRYESERFCIDYVVLHSGKIEQRTFVLITTREDSERNEIVSALAMVVSSVFLVATLLVYSLLPRLRNLHGRVLMAYATSLLTFFFTQSTTTIDYLINSANNEILCNIMGLPGYYSILATFFWMNVMSFDIWYKFRSMMASRPVNRRGETHKFCMYCLYGFGCPLLITVIAGTLNYLPPASIDNAIITLGIPVKGCFLRDKERLFYLYVPMGVLLTANLCLFVATALNIRSLERGARVPRSNNGLRKTQRDKNKFLKYIKIFSLMGVSWLLEIASSFNSRLVLWYLTDALNCLTGVFIFFIFVGKKHILLLVSNRCKDRARTDSNHRSIDQASSSNVTDHSDEDTCHRSEHISGKPM